MAAKYLITSPLTFKITVHGAPEPMQFIEAFTLLEEVDLVELNNEDEEKDSNLSASE